LNYESAQFQTFKRDENKESDSYGESYSPTRRRALFNLYAFTFADSSQKNISKQFGEVDLNRNYQIPTLELRNVEVRNFLYDYQALIYVEKDNYIVAQDPKMANDAESRSIVFHYGDFNVEASIKIHQSVFVDSSFDLGMIFIPPAQKFVDATR